MTRAANEAEVGRPTLEQEMSTFKGFSTNNGETITADKPEDLNPVAGKNQTVAETAALAAKAGEKAPDKAAGKTPATLTDAEHDKVITDLDKSLGREATEAEIAKALADATNTKNGSGKSKAEQKSSDRYKTMQRERNEARRTAAALEARLAALEAGKPAPAAAADKAKPAADEAPDPKKFEYGELDANYIRALARYEAKLEIAAEKEASKTEALTDKQKADKLAFDTARDAFEDAGTELYDDFAEVVIEGARAKAWPLSDALGGALLTSDFGPQIAYELASDVKEAKRIADMPPTRQIAWLGRKEAELESAGSGAKDEGKTEVPKAAAKEKTPDKAPAQVSKAPTPVQRARGQGSASTVPGDTNDFAAFEAAAMARKR